MSDNRVYAKVAVLGVGALLGTWGGVKLLGNAALPLGDLFDAVLAGRDGNTRRALGRLCDALADDLKRTVPGDDGTREAVRLCAEQILSRFGLSDAEFAELGLDARLAAESVLNRYRFLNEAEQREFEEPVRLMLTAFYERLPRHAALLAELTPEIHKAQSADLRRVRTTTERMEEKVDRVLRRVEDKTDRHPADAARLAAPDSQRDGDDAWQRDMEVLSQGLRTMAIEALRASTSAVAELESALGTASPEHTGTVEIRAGHAVDRLMVLAFEEGKNTLCQAHKTLERSRSQEAADALSAVASLVLPWLFVTGDETGQSIDRAWRGGTAGRKMIDLPSRMEEFAEIIMAGLDRQRVRFRRDGDRTLGEFATELPQPIDGLVDLSEENLRTEFFERYKPPTAYANAPRDKKDRAICEMMRFTKDREGRTPHLLCRPPDVESERQRHEERKSRIADSYEPLAIVELGDLMDILDLRIFNQVRTMLLKNGS